MGQWNGVAMMSDPARVAASQHFYSDALGIYGCGAWCGEEWLQLRWLSKNDLSSIAQKELIPIVLACMVWGKEWRGRLVTCHCDNMAVVEVVNSGYYRDGKLAQLLRILFFAKAWGEFKLMAVQHSWVQKCSGGCANQE